MTKDKHFWIEYDGIVKFGIDASKVSMVVNDTEVNIMIPKAKILDCKVESETLNKDSYIVDKDSADITAEDEVKALAESKKQLEENASKDQALFDRAQQEAETLLQNYVKNIGDIVDKEYKVNFVYLDDEGNPIENTDISQNDVNTSDLTE